MTPTLSIIIATAGVRLSLGDTLAALVPQLGDGDEVLVVWDGGPTPEVLKVACDWRAKSYRVRTFFPPGPGPRGDWGHWCRNWALDVCLANGDYLLWIDDDDCHRPSALADVRAAIVLAPDVPHLFRVEVHHETDGGLIWRTRDLAEGNVTTQGIVVPNVPAKLGRFGNRYAGDFDFVKACVDLHGGRVVWDEACIADVFPARDRP